MKRVGVVSTSLLLFALLGATAFGYPQQEHQSEKQGKAEKQAKPEKQKGKQHQNQNKQHAQRQPQQVQNRQQHAQRQPQQNQNKQQQQQRAQQGEERGAWQQRRAHNWESEHRTWQQRGGYNGYRIPDAYFRSHYGRSHSFRVYSLPFMEVGGFPRFQYDGYWFSLVDPVPEYWHDNWYQTDDVYVVYLDNGYYLYDSRYANRPGIAISISF